MGIEKDIPELLEAKVIDQQTADRIREFYQQKESNTSNRLFIVFAVLGAILVGLGIILIIAHNWDDLNRFTKTVFAFLPLVIGQAICFYVLVKKSDNTAWRESSAVFLFYAIGASISLVGQIYNIPGGVGPFTRTWMLLCLPLIYLLRSNVTSLLFICGITYYACHVSYWSYPNETSYLYWAMLLSAVPHYYLLFRNKPHSNFMTFHNWFFPLSVIITLGTLASRYEELMFIAYMSLFGLLYLIGDLAYFEKQKLVNNGFKVMGSLGTIILLLTLSFNWFWEELLIKEFGSLLEAPEFYTSLILTGIGSTLLFKKLNLQFILEKPVALVFLLFLLCFVVGLFSKSSIVVINLMILGVGLLTIREGGQKEHLGILNYGLLTITALIICRFFDAKISFVIRGLMFLLVGAGFFATNYWMLKKRKENG